MTSVRVVVLFGGQSAEHEVSCVTAAHVLAAIDRSKYDVTAVGITTEGQWNVVDAALPSGGSPGALVAAGESVDSTSALTPRNAEQIVALPLMHGPMGEDGTIQGLLELANLPYAGAGVLGSALTMDKAKAKEVLRAAGIPQTKWITLHEPTWDGNTDRLWDELGDSLFIKPSNMGSSVGVSKADDDSQLKTALDLAFTYDEWVVVEETVAAREIEMAVLGNLDLRISVPGEIVPGADFYDFEDKYLDGSAKLIIPAELSRAEVARMEELAAASYQALRVEGMARADFLFEEGGRGPLLNELNTIPGFTPISMYPKLWEASGLGYRQLIDELIDLALERHGRRSAKRAAGRQTSR